MKFLKSAAVVIISFCLLIPIFFLRIVPSFQIWENYQVVYFPRAAKAPVVSAILAMPEFDSVITEDSADYSPKSEFLNLTPILPSFLHNGMDSKAIRKPYFSDKDDNYELCYVPNELFKNFTKLLQKNHVEYGTDSKVKYPYTGFFGALAFALIFAVVARIPFRFWVAVVPFLAAAYYAPFYSTAAYVCPVFFILYIISIYQTRAHSFLQIIKCPDFWISLAAAITCLVSGGFESALIMILCSLISAVMVFLLTLIKKNSAKKGHFSFLTIVPAGQIRFPALKSLVLSILLLVFCGFFLVMPLMSGSQLFSRTNKDLLLPAPSLYTDAQDFSAEAFDGIKTERQTNNSADSAYFVDELWYYSIFPFVRLSETKKEFYAGDAVTVPEYYETEKQIQSRDKILYSLDEDFFEENRERFLKSDGIERLLFSQEGFLSLDYISPGNSTVTSENLLAVIISTVLILLMTIFRAIKARFANDSN